MCLICCVDGCAGEAPRVDRLSLFQYLTGLAREHESTVIIKNLNKERLAKLETNELPTCSQNLGNAIAEVHSNNVIKNETFKDIVELRINVYVRIGKYFPHITRKRD